MLNQKEPMNWQSFRTTLLQNPDKFLQFEYAQGEFVHPSFHITEIKQAPIVSVDCGGKMNSWTEIVVQLWEPTESGEKTDRSMKVSKALSIINLVEKSLPLNPLGIVKIEFGNSRFDTRQMYPGGQTTDGDNFTVSLTPDFTQCKAITRGQRCGVDPSGEPCCTPSVMKEPAQPVFELVEADTSCCTPGSGCC